MDLCVAIFHGHFQYNWVVGALAIVGHGGPWWARIFSWAVHPKIIFKYPWKLAKNTHEPIGMDIHINETCLKTVKSAKNMGHFYRIYATGEQGVI